MKIREIKKEDRQKWIKLVQLTDNRNKEWAEQKLDSYLDSKKKKRLLIVEENVSEILNKEYVLITWIALIPKYRKKGLGSQILKECEKYARKWEKKGIWLGCKEKVIHFYEKNGYHKEGTFINDDGREEYLMLREIG